MTLKMPPPKTPCHMVNHVHRVIGNMNEVARRTEVPVNVLWTARRKSNYVFKTPVYANGVKRVYMDVRGLEDFPAHVEAKLNKLRTAYTTAHKTHGDGDPGPLTALLEEDWPYVEATAHAAESGAEAAGLRYVAGTMLLVADLRHLKPAGFPEDKIARAITEFELASRALANPALKLRALISLTSARQRQLEKNDGGFVPLSEVLERDALVFLSGMQQEQLDNSVTDALNALKLASVLKQDNAMAAAEAALFAQDDRFRSLDFEGWSPITPVSDDPDLAYYHSTKTH